MVSNMIIILLKIGIVVSLLVALAGLAWLLKYELFYRFFPPAAQALEPAKEPRQLAPVPQSPKPVPPSVSEAHDLATMYHRDGLNQSIRLRSRPPVPPSSIRKDRH